MSTFLSRAFRTVVTAAAFVVVAASDAHAIVLVADDFESPVSTFVTYGSASRDCTQANTLSCSLLVPASTGASRSGAADTTPRLLSAATSVAFSFKGDCDYGDMDADVTVRFNTGSATLHVTDYGTSGNDGVSVLSSTSSRNFAAWSPAGTWHSFALDINSVTDTATGRYGTSSATVSIPAGATTITKIDLNGINWNYGCDIRYDSVVVTG